MDKSKKAAFVKAGRQKFSKGGMIRKIAGRKYFDTGGTALAGPTTTGGGAATGGNAIASEQPQFINSTIPMGNNIAGTGVTGSQIADPLSWGGGGGATGALGGVADMLSNKFQATAAPIQQGTNVGQLNNAYTGAQTGLTAQGNLANTLAPQAAGAVANQNNLASQLYGMTEGQGPNPAKAQLAEATAANVAQTGAQMAGARGANANVGLMARQIGQQGAATQQQGVSQAATLEAQQQIAAQQNLANLANNQISQTGQATTGLNSAQQNEQSLLQNANTSANNATVGMQSNLNNVNAQTSAANQNMAGNVVGGITSGISSVASLFSKGGEVKSPHHKLAEMNAISLGMHSYDDGGVVDNNPNLGTFKASQDMASAPNIPTTSSLPAGSSMGGSKGGMFANGGQISANPLLGQEHINPTGNWAQGYFSPESASSGPNVQSTSALPADKTDFSKNAKDVTDSLDLEDMGGNSSSPQYVPGGGSGGAGQAMTAYASGGNIAQGPHKSHVANFLFADGGKVPAMVSPGEIYLSPDKVRMVTEQGADPAKVGHRFGGKAKVKGDSLKNDIIPADLEEGGVVIDRKNMSTREKRELFVHRAIANKKARK